MSHNRSIEPAPTDPMPSPRELWLGVELRHLAALAAIVREGSFRGAADRLGYVPSAISQQLTQLEERVGARLIERSRGSPAIALTEAGRLLLDHVDIILTRFDEARSDLAAVAEGRAGVLKVGAFQSVATRLLPHVVHRFAQASPAVQVLPTETQADGPLFELVERGELDLAFCQLPMVEGPFDSIELIDDPYVLAVSANSPLACREDPPPLEAIGDLPLIGFNNCRAQERMLETLRSRGVRPEFRFRSDLSATVQSLVAADIGVAIVPYLSVDPQHPGTTVVELPELAPRTIALTWHREHKRSVAAERFTEVVRAICARRFRFDRSVESDRARAGDARTTSKRG